MQASGNVPSYDSNNSDFPIKPQKIITEDSNSGYEFFKFVSLEKKISCESSNGKSNIFSMLKNVDNEEVCVIADGAAIGPEMNRLYVQTTKKEKYIDSRSYFSWERYFTDLLITETGDSYLKYQKAKLNLAYLHERNKDIILKSIKGISF